MSSETVVEEKSGDEDYEKGIEEIIDAEGSDEEVEAGARKAEKMVNPWPPTRDEVMEHEITHLPYRNWCKHCIRGRGTEASHRRQLEEPNIPELHMDFMFMGEEGEEGKWTILVAKERLSKMTLATAVPLKTTGGFVARRVEGSLREIGCLAIDINVKTDNEEAIKHLAEEVGRVRAAAGGQGRYNLETSPAYSSSSNGIVERGIRSVQAQVRVIRSALEEKLNVKVDSQHSVWPWIVEYAAFLLNRAEVGRDGRTAYERCKGKRGRVPGLVFGEGVLWRRRPIGRKLAKLTCLWEEGIFLGIKGASGEYIVGDGKGIWKTRTIARRPIDERWTPGNMALVAGVPWRQSEHDDKADGEAWRMDVPPVVAPRMDDAEPGEWKAVVPRRMGLRREDFEKYGYSGGCPGCKALLKGTARQGHSDACRRRMEKEMHGDPRWQAAQRKMDEFVSKAIEADDKKRREETDQGKAEGEGKRRKVEDGDGLEAENEGSEIVSEPRTNDECRIADEGEEKSSKRQRISVARWADEMDEGPGERT